jgi:hypothetical protein
MDGTFEFVFGLAVCGARIGATPISLHLCCRTPVRTMILNLNCASTLLAGHRLARLRRSAPGF